MKKLIIKNGIIQNKSINGIPIKIDIIQPQGKRNVRTLIPMRESIGFTNHNTANTAPTAGDEMNSKYFQKLEDQDDKYIGAHLFVDKNSITQVIPLNEEAYHAGDGKNGPGNSKTIGIEICENKNYRKAEKNAKYLNAALLLTYPGKKIFKHQDWSGKFCPGRILRENRWPEFVDNIKKIANNNSNQNPLVDWKREIGEQAIDDLVAKGLINNPKEHKEDLNKDEIEPWLFWEMMNRISEGRK